MKDTEEAEEKGHAPRERVSWNVCWPKNCLICTCHAPRERVSWNDKALKETNKKSRHAPRERVSWNKKGAWYIHTLWVTLHVSVWVEIQHLQLRSRFHWGHAPRERVSWNDKLKEGYKNDKTSRSTWACELKLNRFTRSAGLTWSRSTWACELKCAIISSHWNTNPVTLHVSVWVEMSNCDSNVRCW